jgi:hypothetical protein
MNLTKNRSTSVTCFSTHFARRVEDRWSLHFLDKIITPGADLGGSYYPVLRGEAIGFDNFYEWTRVNSCFRLSNDVASAAFAAYALPRGWEPTLVLQNIVTCDSSLAGAHTGNYFVGFQNTEIDGFLFQLQVGDYFRSKGGHQRELRKQLSSALIACANFNSRLDTVLRSVADLASQDSLPAAIDLLISVGDKLADRVLKASGSQHLDSENVAFVLAAAASRRPGAVVSMLLQSKHRAIREGVVESVATWTSAEARTILQIVSENDDSQALRGRALELLGELE